MRRAGKDRAGAVIHQDEVGDPDRQFPIGVQRVAHADAGVHPQFFGRLDGLRCGAALAAFGDEGGDLGVVRLKHLGNRMIGRNADEGRAEQGVGPGGEHLDRVAAVGALEAEAQAARFADPVGLHQPHFLGPVLQRVDGVEQLLGEIGDLEEPLRQLAPLDLGARAPALAVDHLLVGKHGHVDRIPVDHRVLAVDQPLCHEVDKHRLLLAIIFRVAGCEHPAPVQPEAKRLHLGDHRVDIVVGPGFRVAPACHRGVFSGHPEGVKPHRVQHVMARRHLVARHHVAHRVVAHVADMDAARGVWKHFEHVVFGLRGIAPGLEGAGLVPGFLPFRLDHARIVARHMWSPDMKTPGSGPGAGLVLRVKTVQSQAQSLRSWIRSCRARARIASSILWAVSVETGPPRDCSATSIERASSAGSRT